MESAAASRALGNAQNYFDMRNASEKGSFSYEYYNSMYQSEIRKTFAYKKKVGEGFVDSYTPPVKSPEKINIDLDFDSESLASSGYIGFDVHPDAHDNSVPPADFGPPPEYYNSMPEYYGPPPEDEYYGPY